MVTNFQRARSEEQREQRRQAILRTAAAMLTEMPVAEVSLNELSRRVGLAKSNVLRYFESREAVLLELLDLANGMLLADLEVDLAAAVDPDAGVRERVDAVAAVLASALGDRPMLCDLAGAQAAVLERNVSAEVAARYKRAAIAGAESLAGLVRRHVPELDGEGALLFAGIVLLTSGAVWAHTHPSAAMLEAYAADPSLAAVRLEFTGTLRLILEVALSGILAR